MKHLSYGGEVRRGNDVLGYFTPTIIHFPNMGCRLHLPSYHRSMSATEV
jgi:hypothetical protein